jgi:hypothetical protein
MQAIEFTTKAHNGVIENSKKHPEEPCTIAPQKKKKLTSLKIKTKGFAFDRDEANER